MKILDLQPSQLYLSKEKLIEIDKTYQLGKKLDPIPIKELNNRIIMTDGHTRAYYLYKIGIKEIDVVWDTDKLDLEMYQMCVDWSLELGIESIQDLESRVIPDHEYKIKWLKKCKEAREELEEKRKGKIAK